VGFQLSYIVLFHNLAAAITSASWNPRNKPEIYLGILTVSFAAQIGTMPLSIYYFHQSGLFSSEPRSHPLLKFYNDTRPWLWYQPSLVRPSISFKTTGWSIYYYLNKIINLIASFSKIHNSGYPLNTYLLLSSYLLIV
jgi:competence protein ComEC